MKSQAKKQSKIVKVLLLPIRVLSRARDFYVKSLEDCASRVGNGGVMGGPTVQVSRLPKSFSVNSSKGSDDEEFRELLRAASRRGGDSGFEHKMMQQPSGLGQLRSYSVGIGKIGRIDEDEPCNFEEENCSDLLYPRSRSYAVRRNVVYYK